MSEILVKMVTGEQFKFYGSAAEQLRKNFGFSSGTYLQTDTDEGMRVTINCGAIAYFSEKIEK